MAVDAAKYPKFVEHIRLDGMPNAIEFGKDERIKTRLTQLQPIFESPLTVTKLTENGMRYVLTHPNGKTIQQIIQDKLNEKGDDASRGDIQGATIGGSFDYNKCHFAELNCNATEELVIVLNAESPAQIFVCPCNQIGLAEHLQDQIQSYVAATGGNFLGASPEPNHLCIAQSQDDNQWYRAVCCQEKGQDTYELLFVDYGNMEDVQRKNIMHMTEELMKTPILANHCVLEGFEDHKQSELYEKVFGKKVQTLLPPFEEEKIVVVRKLPKSGSYVVRIPRIAEDVNQTLLIKAEKETQMKDEPKSVHVEKVDTVDKPIQKEVKSVNESTSKKEAIDQAINIITKGTPGDLTESETPQKVACAKEIVTTKVECGNQVLALCLGETSDKIYVQRLDDAEMVEEIGVTLKSRCSKRETSFIPKVGQIVACKWSDDDELYRAEVLEVLEDCVKVYFIDYGNQETEGMKNVMELPQELSMVPKLAVMLTLDNVKQVVNTADKFFSKTVQTVESQFLEDIFDVVLINDGRYVLQQSDGKLLNETISLSFLAAADLNTPKDVTSEENMTELKEKLTREAKQRKEDEDKMKDMEQQMKKMQEMLAKMSK